MTRSKSSGRWLEEHHNDSFVKQARAAGYRSRAAYKLLQLQQQDKLIRKGMTVVDLGAAPGGWSQVALELLQDSGRVVALDLLPMAPIVGVDFIQGDFREPEPLQKLEGLLGDAQVDLVLSDMAPNMSGVKTADQAGVMYVAELALEFAIQHLSPRGALVVKVFRGSGFDPYLLRLREVFVKVQLRKPEASRQRSAELYLVAAGRR